MSTNDDLSSPFGLDAHGVPHAFTAAVTTFAEITKLDPQALLRGDGLRIGEFNFWLQHYGEQDPTGLTIFVDLGRLDEMPPEQELPMLRQMLENNANNPAGLCGFFARRPDTGQLVYGFRLALDQTRNGGEALAQMLLSLLSATQLMRDTLLKSVAILEENADLFAA